MSYICSKYQFRPDYVNQLERWFKERSSEVFKADTNGSDNKGKLIKQLYKTIGKLTINVGDGLEE